MKFSPGLFGKPYMPSFVNRGKPSLHRRLLDSLTTIEMFIYRSAVIPTFVVYAYKHIRAEWLGP